MGRVGVVCVVAGALALGLGAAGEAAAQSNGAGQQQPPGKYKAQPLNLTREKLGSEGLGATARSRMKNGDCAGAIEVFDAALRTSIDSSLHRDRGLCHEKLGHAYPAIDDYRAYLTAQPEATDADDIRGRLEKLEEDTLGYSSASLDAPGDVEGGASAAAAAHPTAPSASTKHPVHAPEALDYVDREDDPLQVPLRRGKGWSISPFFAEHKWGQSPGLIALTPGAGASFGDNGTWSECFGLEIRRSIGPSGALFAELGYEHFNSTNVDVALVSGLTSQLGYEFRFALSPDYDNQLILGLGLGYEHLSIQPTTAQISNASLGAFVPRVRVGYRRLLTPSAGLEASLDGGAANFFQYSRFGFESDNSTSYLFALNVALLWGL